MLLCSNHWKSRCLIPLQVLTTTLPLSKSVLSIGTLKYLITKQHPLKNIHLNSVSYGLQKRTIWSCWTPQIPHFLNLTICQTKNAAAFFRSLSAPVLFLDLTTWLYVYIRVTLGPTDLVFYCRWTIYERNIVGLSIKIRLNVNLFLKYTSALKIQIVRFSFKMHGSKQRLLPDDPENALGSSLFNKVIHHPITELQQQTSYFWGYADWFVIMIWKDHSLSYESYCANQSSIALLIFAKMHKWLTNVQTKL